MYEFLFLNLIQPSKSENNLENDKFQNIINNSYYLLFLPHEYIIPSSIFAGEKLLKALMMRNKDDDWK